MKKSILITLLLSSTVLSGCNSIKEAAGNMVLGEDLIQASEIGRASCRERVFRAV